MISLILSKISRAFAEPTDGDPVGEPEAGDDGIKVTFIF